MRPGVGKPRARERRSRHLPSKGRALDAKIFRVPAQTGGALSSWTRTRLKGGRVGLAAAAHRAIACAQSHPHSGSIPASPFPPSRDNESRDAVSVADDLKLRDWRAPQQSARPSGRPLLHYPPTDSQDSQDPNLKIWTPPPIFFLHNLKILIATPIAFLYKYESWYLDLEFSIQVLPARTSLID